MKSRSTASILKNTHKLLLSKKYAFIVGILLFGLVQIGVQLAWQNQFRSELQMALVGITGSEEQAEQLALTIAMKDRDGLVSALSNNPLMNGSFESMSSIEQLQYMEQYVFASLQKLVPAIMVLLTIMSILTLLAVSYYYIVSTQKKHVGILEAMILFMKRSTDLCLLAFWSSIRSFSWIPIIGPLLALYYLPRLLLSPVILLREDTGIVKSVKRSIDMSKGYYGYIAWQTTVFAIIAILILWVFALISNSLMGVSYYVAVAISAVGYQLATAYTIAALTRMSIVILKSAKNS